MRESEIEKIDHEFKDSKNQTTKDREREDRSWTQGWYDHLERSRTREREERSWKMLRRYVGREEAIL